jgi:hypothetical protein
MTSRDFRNLYLSLSDPEKLRLLARVAFNLTIDARDTYVAGSEEIADPVRLRRFNELQHRLLSRVSSMAERNPTTAEDEEHFVDFLLEGAKEARAGFSLREAMEWFGRHHERAAIASPSKKVG